MLLRQPLRGAQPELELTRATLLLGNLIVQDVALVRSRLARGDQLSLAALGRTLLRRQLTRRRRALQLRHTSLQLHLLDARERQRLLRGVARLERLFEAQRECGRLAAGCGRFAGPP